MTVVAAQLREEDGAPDVAKKMKMPEEMRGGSCASWIACIFDVGFVTNNLLNL